MALAALKRRPQPPRPDKRKLDGEAEAQLVMLACSPAPEGHEHWTLDLLADRMVRLRYVPAVSRDTVGRSLKKTRSSRGCKTSGASRRGRAPNSSSGWRTCWTLTNGRKIRPARSWGWTANIFCAFEPLAGRRRLVVTDRRTKRDFAVFVKSLLDGRYRDVEKLVLVLDNLNTHSPASLYEAFGPAEARRLADRLEIHHTPRHGSWLNVAEIELSALGKANEESANRKTQNGLVKLQKNDQHHTPTVPGRVF